MVTGAAGFIGSHLCERLLAEGGRVLGVDCFTDYYDRERKERNLASARASDRFELAEADLGTADLRGMLDGVDGVFHLAAQPGVRGSWGERFEVYARNNILATQCLLEALRERPVPLVYASSSSVYGAAERLPVREEDLPRPLSPYGVTKLAAEHLTGLYAAAYGLAAVSLRYFTVYGPRQRPDMAFTRFLGAALAGLPLEVLGDGEQSRDFTFVADAVEATRRALGAPPGVYNIGGGTRATVNESIRVIEELVGHGVEVRRREAVRGDMPHTWAETSRARERLGWEPRTTLHEGLAAHLAWARALRA
ncbi:MAG: GDP-mannose 4,6-dehydratase [Acidobacteria bacterium]|nr:GDP-mannose 4,6-dehydratase [Acidobacteriota bacterium]